MSMSKPNLLTHMCMRRASLFVARRLNIAQFRVSPLVPHDGRLLYDLDLLRAADDYLTTVLVGLDLSRHADCPATVRCFRCARYEILARFFRLSGRGMDLRVMVSRPSSSNAWRTA